MRFRLTDERTWESAPFEADSPAALRRGIVAALDTRSPDAGTHPAFALASMLREVDAWLAERMARPNATDEQRRSWTANAEYRRWNAREACGDTQTTQARLHVDASAGVWVAPNLPGPPIAAGIGMANRTAEFGPVVSRRITPAEAEDLFARSAAAVAWSASIRTWARETSAEAVPVPQLRPQLRIVRDEDDDE